MNFNSRYVHYQNELPPYMLKRIAKCIEKKYNISDANEYIDYIFKKYQIQYQKKKKYDQEYTGPLKQNFQQLQKDYFNVVEQNDKLHAFIWNNYGKKL